MKRLAWLSVSAAVYLGASASAAELLWAPSNGTWDNLAANWWNGATGSLVPFANNDNVTFDDSGSAFTNLTLTGLLTPGSVTVDSSLNYTFSSTTGGKMTNAFALTKRGLGKLVLDCDNVITNTIQIDGGTLEIGAGGSRGAFGAGEVINNGTLSFNRTGTQTYSNTVSGGGLIQTLPGGTGTVNLRGPNTMYGSYLVSAGGILNFMGDSSLGNPANITIAPVLVAANARFQITSNVNLSAGCTIYMTNASNARRCAVQSMDATNSVSGPILVGPIAPGDTNNGLAQLITQNAGNQLDVYSNVDDLDSSSRYSGSFYLRGANGVGNLYGTINLPAATLVKTDANGLWILHSAGNAAANIFIAQGTVRLGTNNGLPDCPLVMAQAAATATLDLAGYDQQVTTLNDLGGTGVIGSSSVTRDSRLTLFGGGLFNGSIQDSLAGGNRKVGLTLAGGAQQFSGILTYSGPTIITGGGIVLIGNGALPNTSSIDITGPSAIDVSGRSDATLTVGPAQTLKGSGTFNVTGKLVNQGTIQLKLNKANGTVTNDKLAVTSQLTYGGKLSLVLGGESLTAADTLPLFTAGSYAGAFATIEPATPAASLRWDTSTLATDGVLRVAAAEFRISTTLAAGSNIVFNVTGGTPNSGYTILTSTNVTRPFANWDVSQTGTLDSTGNIVVTNQINAAELQRYFIFRMP